MNSIGLSKGPLLGISRARICFLSCKNENNSYSLKLVTQNDPAGKLRIWESSHFLFSYTPLGVGFLISKASRELLQGSLGHAACFIGFGTNCNEQFLLCLSPLPLASTLQLAVTHQKIQDRISGTFSCYFVAVKAR